jgi:hypothetical protein
MGLPRLLSDEERRRRRAKDDLIEATVLESVRRFSADDKESAESVARHLVGRYSSRSGKKRVGSAFAESGHSRVWSAAQLSKHLSSFRSYQSAVDRQREDQEEDEALLQALSGLASPQSEFPASRRLSDLCNLLALLFPENLCDTPGRYALHSRRCFERIARTVALVAGIPVGRVASQALQGGIVRSRWFPFYELHAERLPLVHWPDDTADLRKEISVWFRWGRWPARMAELLSLACPSPDLMCSELVHSLDEINSWSGVRFCAHTVLQLEPDEQGLERLNQWAGGSDPQLLRFTALCVPWLYDEELWTIDQIADFLARVDQATEEGLLERFRDRKEKSPDLEQLLAVDFRSQKQHWTWTCVQCLGVYETGTKACANGCSAHWGWS